MLTFPSFFNAQAGGYEIEQSLRFDGSSYFSRTYSSAGNRKTFTISVWVKRAGGGSSYSNQYLFGAYDGGGSQFNLAFYGSGANTELAYDQGYTGPGSGYAYTNAKYRDHSAWYHIVYVADYSNSTAADRWRFYVNGERITSFRLTSAVVNGDASWNYQGAHYIGRIATGTSNNFNGYMAELHILDGTAVTNADDFGETNDQGVWVPKKVSGVTYGTNGVYLKFDPSATNGIGHDHSGNGNNWSPTGFDTTNSTAATYDVMSDTPTTNWCTLNPLSPSQSEAVLANGNLDCTWTNVSGHTRRSTIAVGSGKWYAEITRGTSTLSVGLVDADLRLVSWPGNSTYGSTGSYAYRTDNGNKYNNGSGSSYGSTVATGDVIGIAYDGDNGALYFSKNGTWQNSGDPTSGASATGAAFTGLGNQTWTIACGNAGGSTNGTATNFNFGQRDFAYTPPTGYKALNTSNLTAPTVKDGSKYFDTVAYSGATSGTAGAGTTQTVTGLSFSPDLVWIKNRTNGNSHGLFDQVRGAVNALRTDTNGLEATTNSSGALSAFNSNGFTLANGSSGSDQAILTHQSGYTYVGWCWDAGDSGSSNTDGSITSTVSANPSAGFSIVTYTGTSANATVGHGLGVGLSMVMVKSRDDAFSWHVGHSSLGWTKYINLNTTNAASTLSTVWQDTAPSSTVFSLGTDQGVNKSGSDFIAYCFAEVEGYSKFGSYTGNGSSDGPFVYCGFRPAWVMVKGSSFSLTNWYVYDTTRGEYNPTNLTLAPDSSGTEPAYNATSTAAIDIVSNGFKIRGSGSTTNDSGGTLIFAAFAENPFGGSGVSPATAR